MPNAEKRSPQSREVTIDNCGECLSLIRESALFEFKAFDIGHVTYESQIQQEEVVFGRESNQINRKLYILFMYRYLRSP